MDKAEEATMEGQNSVITEQRSRIESLGARIRQLTEERDNANGALTNCTKLIEGRIKDNESLRYENIQLRESLQRTLGYIDRVNENDPPLESVEVQPAQFTSRRRGPQLNNYGYVNRADGCEFDGPSTSHINRRY